jgi:hypothetical protein
MDSRLGPSASTLRGVPKWVIPTEVSSGAAGSVSMGLMHATPGDIKSLRSSADKIALIAGWRGARLRTLKDWNMCGLEIEMERVQTECLSRKLGLHGNIGPRRCDSEGHWADFKDSCCPNWQFRHRTRFCRPAPPAALSSQFDRDFNFRDFNLPSLLKWICGGNCVLPFDRDIIRSALYFTCRISDMVHPLGASSIYLFPNRN